MSFTQGEQVNFGGESAIVLEDRGDDGYLISSGPARLPFVIPADVLEDAQRRPAAKRLFTPTAPHLLSVDDFLDDPDEVRRIALNTKFHSDLAYFKGLRSDHRYLWPGLREEFSRLLGTPVTEWLGHGANGVFQQTAHDDPLVWHHDTQSYAAAIYLNPNPPAGAGTSFWRDRTYGCRRAPHHPKEEARLGSPEAVEAARSVVYDAYNIQHEDNWELIESISGQYNRLVIWDAKLMHSATSYEHFAGKDDGTHRLVQLFFFDIAV
ncbi:DUF6445 family protein [Streptomyces sp. NPDC006012]|uniref:DUF6445 family protein n=1 Tax=Streptomyces sp. NPDC006012 TaxID=3364739 RepID=UPI0036B7C219